QRRLLDRTGRRPPCGEPLSTPRAAAPADGAVLRAPRPEGGFLRSFLRRPPSDRGLGRRNHADALVALLLLERIRWDLLGGRRRSRRVLRWQGRRGRDLAVRPVR